jgi:hypothetical protein
MNHSIQKIKTQVYCASVFMILDLPTENYIWVRERMNMAGTGSSWLPAPPPYTSPLSTLVTNENRKERDEQ